jgi:16S rRNA (cytidine1402-2'-O)-methyltransferase
MLSIVATPIGNLKDITLRAIETLKKCDYIICEDTKHSKILLKNYNIKKPLLSFHSYSTKKQFNKIINLLNDNNHLSLISDAGTPGISDPGYKITSYAVNNDIKIEPIPGPSAFLCALQACGLPINKFIYYGFLPAKKGRKKIWTSLKKENKTIVFYESRYKLLKTLNEIKSTWGQNQYIIIANELTKLYENYNRAQVNDIITYYTLNKPRGEFVIIIPFNKKNK